jgi:hypothetical protein
MLSVENSASRSAISISRSIFSTDADSRSKSTRNFSAITASMRRSISA